MYAEKKHQKYGHLWAQIFFGGQLRLSALRRITPFDQNWKEKPLAAFLEMHGKHTNVRIEFNRKCQLNVTDFRK